MTPQKQPQEYYPKLVGNDEEESKPDGLSDFSYCDLPYEEK